MKKKIPNNIESVLQKFIIGVNEILGHRVKKIILYGSYARGDYNRDSDIDIMILTDLSDDEIIEYKNKIVEYAYEIEYENNFEIEIMPLVKNLDKFNYLLEALPFYMNIQKEGVVLNEYENI